MKTPALILLQAFLIALPMLSHADPWKDESGHGKRRGHDRREYKEDYWDGHCKVERKVKKNGDYKEERKCDGPQHGYREPSPVYAPAPSVRTRPS